MAAGGGGRCFQLYVVIGVVMQRHLKLNRNSTIEYPNYKFHFCIRALGRHENEYVPAMRKLLQLQDA